MGQQQQAQQQQVFKTEPTNQPAQLPQSNQWYSNQPQQPRMMNQQQRQALQTQQAQGPRSMMHQQHQNAMPNQSQQQMYSNQRNWIPNPQQFQPQRVAPPDMRSPPQVTRMNSVRFMNPQSVGMIPNSQPIDSSQDMLYQQQPDFSQQMGQQQDITSQDQLTKFVDNL